MYRSSCGLFQFHPKEGNRSIIEYLLRNIAPQCTFFTSKILGKFSCGDSYTCSSRLYHVLSVLNKFLDKFLVVTVTLVPQYTLFPWCILWQISCGDSYKYYTYHFITIGSKFIQYPFVPVVNFNCIKKLYNKLLEFFPLSFFLFL